MPVSDRLIFVSPPVADRLGAEPVALFVTVTSLTADAVCANFINSLPLVSGSEVKAVLASVTALAAIFAVVTALEARLAAAIDPLNSLYIVSKLSFIFDELIVVLELKVLGFEIVDIYASPFCIIP